MSGHPKRKQLFPVQRSCRLTASRATGTFFPVHRNEENTGKEKNLENIKKGENTHPVGPYNLTPAVKRKQNHF